MFDIFLNRLRGGQQECREDEFPFLFLNRLRGGQRDAGY